MRLTATKKQARYEVYAYLVETLHSGMDSTAANEEIPFVMKRLEREAGRWLGEAQASGADPLHDDLVDLPPRCPETRAAPPATLSKEGAEEK